MCLCSEWSWPCSLSVSHWFSFPGGSSKRWEETPWIRNPTMNYWSKYFLHEQSAAEAHTKCGSSLFFSQKLCQKNKLTSHLLVQCLAVHRKEGLLKSESCSDLLQSNCDLKVYSRATVFIFNTAQISIFSILHSSKCPPKFNNHWPAALLWLRHVSIR